MKNLYRVLLSLFIMLFTLILANCGRAPGCGPATFGSTVCSTSGGGGGGFGGGGGGGTVSASKAAALVYYGSSSVGAAGVTSGSSGVFDPLSSYTPPTLTGFFPDNMLIVNKQFLYIPLGDTTVAGYSITRSTGALTLIPGSPFTIPGGVGTADDLATDPLGRFLFVGCETVPAVWVFTINSATGALTAVAGSPFTTGLAAGGATDILTVDASGKFLYAGQTDPTLGVGGFTISSTGALTAMTGSPFSLGIAQLHASPTSELLLGVAEVADGTVSATDPHIYAYSLDPNTGVPTAIPGSPFLTLAAPFDLVISPNGSFVYALEAFVGVRKDAPMEGFQINSGGALTSLGTFNGVPTSESCQFDQSGIYLFCADTISGAVLTVNVASPSTGVLTHGLDLAASPNFPFAVTD